MNHDITVLYVEDEEDIRMEMSEILEFDFAKVLVATNGEEGLALFKQEDPDIVISDVQMPKLDGLSMCKAIRKISKNLPIILTTAFTEQQYLAEAESLNVSFVNKPVNIEQLYECIEKSLA